MTDISGTSAWQDGQVADGGYDALLLLSFGGPEGPDEVIPFLENVTRGRGIPRERLVEVGEHYFRFGGVSPINAQCRALLAAVRADLDESGIELPVYWGNRNWHPMLVDTVREMADNGVRRALVFVTAAYASYPSCRQYREDMAAARAVVGDEAPELHRLRHYFNHPGFIEPLADAAVTALSRLPAGSHLAFTTHSIPVDWAAASGPTGNAYVTQHLSVAGLLAARAAVRMGSEPPWQLVYQSRSGRPSQPWLGPDVGEHLAALAADGVSGVALVPIGFVSDHMEVRYDLDVEAADAAAKLGLRLARAATPGTDPRFVAMVRDLVTERLDGRPVAARAALGSLGASYDICPAGCCPNPRGARPACSGED